MKVLHVIPSVPQVRGGTSQAILDMVKALRDNKIDAEIATTNDNGDDLLDVPLQKRVEYEHVPVWFFHRFSPTVKPLREYAFSRQFTYWLWSNICNYQLVHVHALFSYLPTITMAIARRKNIPYIVTPHGLLCQWSLQQSAHKKQVYLGLIERANLSCSQAIHFTSQQEQQEVFQLKLETPNLVLPLGISLPKQIPDARVRLRQRFNISTNKPIILFLSRLHPKKGLDYLIPALSKVAHYRFTFILAGSGAPEYEAEINSLITFNGLRDRTFFAGFVEGETKDLLLQGSDLFVLTSHSENFSVAVLEALAVGLPVLATPGVALASIVQQHKLGYVTKLDVLAISNALEHYLNHPQAAKEMGDRACQLILERYTCKQIASQMQQVYTDILNQNSTPALSLKTS